MMGNTMDSGDMPSDGDDNNSSDDGGTADAPAQKPAEDSGGCSVGTMGTTASHHVGAMGLGLSALIVRARRRTKGQPS